MHMKYDRSGRWLFPALAITLALFSSNAGRLHAQSAVESDPVLQAWRGRQSIFACQQCHGRSTAVGIESNEGLHPGAFSRQNELHQWIRHDKHAIARTRVEPLTAAQVAAERDRAVAAYGFTSNDTVEQWVGPSNELSLRICETLGWKITTDEGYSRFAASCLNCHGGYRGTPADEEGFARPADLAHRQPGISCNYCHQAESFSPESPGEQPEWIFRHASLGDPQTRWRIQPPAEKTRLGMADLVDTVQQANLCLDCHVGNLERKMFVSHDMYAAGHPPLPSFELETFCNSMPQHWRSLGELNQALTEADYPDRETYYRVNFPELTERLTSQNVPLSDVFWNTRKMLLGAVTAHRRSVQLLTQAAASGGPWGDYALYDCTACHHDLRRPSRRQQRSTVGPPGRPRLPEWPQALLGTALELAGEPLADEVLSEQQKLTLAVTAVPFGDPSHCGPAATTLLDSLDEAIQRLKSQPVTAPVALAVIQQLSGTPEEALLEYGAARQVAWAVLVAADELTAAGHPLPPEVTAELEGWRSQTESPGAPQASGSVGIAMALPSGRETYIYPDNLRAELERRREYDESQLAASLKRIHQALTEDSPP